MPDDDLAQGGVLDKGSEMAPPDALFRMLVDSVRDYAIFVLDTGGHVATWNRGAQRIKGYTASEIVGKHFSVFYPPEAIASGVCEMELEVAAREGRFEDEGWRVKKDGTRFWANVIISAVRDDLGNLVAYSKVTRDLTERRRSEEEAAARQAAEQANRTKDEFLAMLGHELRNPLAPILSALQLLKLRGDPRSARELQVIERQVKQMVRLVDDLLDVSRISRGKIELRRQRMDLREALAKAVEIVLPTIERKNQHFDVQVPDAPLFVEGDDARLTQVFANLLNNAAKYTDEGGFVRLSVHRTADELVTEIRDNGVGIEPALLPRLFELFVQGYQDADRAEGGLGIGLTIVRSLVQLHGGFVEASSEGLRKGSTFAVRLPAAPALSPVPTLQTTPSPPSSEDLPRRILVVDDNDDARDLLTDMLKMFGHEVRSAGDGFEALELLQTFVPDVAILDIGLPEMTGYELARRIRETLAPKTTKLLALTGYGGAQDAAQAEEAGFAAHLVKPIDLNRLLEHIGGPRTRKKRG